MLTKRKKLSRKEIKEDGLITFYYKIVGLYGTYKQNFLYGGIAVIVLAAAAFFYVQQRNSNNERANIELSRVIPVFDSGMYLEAIQGNPAAKVMGLKKIVAEYGNSENGEIAKVYLANAYSYLGKVDDALKNYEDYSGSNVLFKAAAFAGEAACYESKNDNEKAAELYRKASSVSEENALNPQYLLFSGINLIKAKKIGEAKEILERIKKDFPTSTSGREVDRYLAQVE
ncbi:MAG: tetratricopeptide repeat protein [Ignavibacteriaceae bacterium]|jgi:tetratricopeptide (TPR) repeat protein